MILLPGEEKLVTSNGEKIILTNHRIYMADSDWYSSFSIVIFLEDISSIQTKYVGNIVFLILGCLALSSGIYGSFQNYPHGSFNFGYIGGAILFLLWWLSRRNLISISSHAGSSLNFQVEQLSKEQIENFIFKIQSAKAKRINRLYKIEST